MDKEPTMCEKALSMLQANGSITKADFFYATKSANLNEYIRLLRNKGHNILTEKPDIKKRCTYTLVTDGGK